MTTNRTEQTHRAVLPAASMASYPLEICETSDRHTGREGCDEEVVEEEEKNVTGCGDIICQGNKRSYRSLPACSFWPRPHVSESKKRSTWQRESTEMTSGQGSKSDCETKAFHGKGFRNMRTKAYKIKEGKKL